MTDTVRVLFGPDAHRLRGVQGDLITEEWKKFCGFYEPVLLSWIFHRNRPGVYVDVGAHAGNHTCFFASQCPATEVVSFEPHPVLFDLLRENTSIYPHVTVHNKAIHASWKCAELVPGPDNNLGKTWIKNGAGVDVVTLDTALQDSGHVALIKADVEGCEASVLASAAEILGRDKPIVCVEVLDDGKDVKEVLLAFRYKHVATYGGAPVQVWV